MTARQISHKTNNRGATLKGGLIQFRADEELMNALSQVADSLHLPLGVLARLWVSERLNKELSLDLGTIETWLEKRYKIIGHYIEQEFDPGPIQILHLIPFRRQLEIEPDRVQLYDNLLSPLELDRITGFTNRINLDGYQIIKQFEPADKMAGSVQVFRTGQLESIRRIATDNELIYAHRVDDDLIRATWSYCCALDVLKIKTPVALFVGFNRMKGYRLKSKRSMSPSCEIAYEEFRLEAITIKDWSQVLTIENTAQTVKQILDQFANSAGLARSMSYSANGEWLGLSDREESYQKKARMIARTDVIELSGINRDANRVDLVLHDADKEFVLGKVRAPYLEPTDKTQFKCFVNQNEMAPGAKQQLEQKKQMAQPATFSIGKLRFSGLVTHIAPCVAGDSFDGASALQGLMFYIQPGFRARL